MKKFNLTALGFAYMLFNDGSLTKLDGNGEKIVADKSGNVKLVAAKTTKYNKKQYKAGEEITMPIEDVLTWVEDEQWEEVPNEAGEGASDTAKDANKERIAELRKAEKKAQTEALMADPSEFPAKKEAWMKIKTELDELTAKTPKASKAKKEEIKYSEDEQKAIDAYLAKKASVDVAKVAIDTATAEMKTAKEALPTTYKTKGTRSTGTGGGPKPPQMTDDIRINIVKAIKGEAYNVHGTDMPALEGGLTVAKTARAFGYSGAYTALAKKKGEELIAAKK